MEDMIRMEIYSTGRMQMVLSFGGNMIRMVIVSTKRISQDMRDTSQLLERRLEHILYFIHLKNGEDD